MSHPDLEAGQGHYELQDRGSMATVLSKRRKIDRELARIASKQQQLQLVQQEFLDAVSPAEEDHAHSRITAVNDELASCLRRVRNLIAEIKRAADVTNPRIKAQVDYVSSKLWRQMEEHHRLQSTFAKQVRSQVRRRYEITHPDATEEETRAGVEQVLLGNETALFEIHGMRTRQASDTRAAVAQRSAAIRKIEQDMLALHELYQDVATLIENQQDYVEKTEQNAAQTAENYKQSNSYLSRAITSARNARKWKWWALFVCREYSLFEFTGIDA
ncbi:t-SNARE [Penicillium hispanicum]|uniref:t-SNARE n=1 Tax=Penicillium hispanicum TaxID=1080232 RepID=UPI0025424EA5|nr:t-SNARE [Penicillium hispanicum]KAJ5595435.1 t-SNARE [Penicillium hispanicum]